MASKSAQQEPVNAEAIEEALDTLDKNLDRVKSLYEQYFLGIQKQPPTFLHTDIERKLRDLTQIQIRNTALRYRFVTLQQKFGSYHAYWRRTLRQIENGTYLRQLSKLSRQASRNGEEIPEEILAAMPKRMREQVKRDREAALALAKRRGEVGGGEVEDALADEGTRPRALPIERAAVGKKDARGAHVLTADDADFDMDAFFASMTVDYEEGTDEPTESGPPPQPEPLFAPKQRPVAPQPTPTSRSVGPQQTPAQRQAVPPQPTPVPAQKTPPPPPQRQTQPIPAQRQSQPIPTQPAQRQSQPIPTQSQVPASRQSQPIPTQPRAATQPGQPPPGVAVPPQRTMRGLVPTPPSGMPAHRGPTGVIPGIPSIPSPPGRAPSQAIRPNPIAPGAMAGRTDAPVESMDGPFPRRADTNLEFGSEERTPPSPAPMRPAQQQMRPTPRPAPPVSARAVPTAPRPAAQPQAAPAMKPPPGMSDADVNALYAKYVKAKEMVGEQAGPGAYGKLLKTINAQAPKIMEQYKSRGVDFTVVVKDNQVVIRAKPKP